MTTPFPGTILPQHDRGPAALFALMARQHGVASCAQARELGVSRAVERRLLREGAIVPALSGVLAAGGVRSTFVAKAMAASLRPGVLAVSHGTAARLHRLAGFDDYELVDVIGDKGAHLQIDPPIITHYSRGPVADQVAHVGAVPVTSIALTLALLAPTAGRTATTRALADALGRGIPASAIRSVALAWRGPGRSGPGVLLALLDGAGRAA